MDTRSLLRQGPFFVASRCYLADIAERKGNKEEAKRVLEEVVEWANRNSRVRQQSKLQRKLGLMSIEKRLEELEEDVSAPE